MAATFIGTIVSSYLTWVHYSGSLALCVGVGGCEAVQSSRYSTIGPLPVALLGLLGFGALLAVALARLRSDAVELDIALLGLALGAALYVIYLTYVEIFVLGAVCPWCFAVAICALSTFVAAAIDVALPAEGPGDPKTQQKRPSSVGHGSLRKGPDGTASAGKRPASLVSTEARRNTEPTPGKGRQT